MFSEVNAIKWRRFDCRFNLFPVHAQNIFYYHKTIFKSWNKKCVLTVIFHAIYCLIEIDRRLRE